MNVIAVYSNLSLFHSDAIIKRAGLLYYYFSEILLYKKDEERYQSVFRVRYCRNFR